MMAELDAVILASPGIAMGLSVLRHRSRALPSSSRSTRWLASSMEEQMFHRLDRQYPSQHYIVSAHMLLADVIGRDRLVALSSFDRSFAWKAHCDFVIVERSTLRVLKVIEVNGAFHRQATQIRRDKQKSQLLQQFGIVLEVV